ncbi:MAG: S8 family serine peptidase, partial [Muribaculaceae bacterium]
MKYRLFLFSLILAPMLSWGQVNSRLSAELQSATLTASTDDLIPVIIALKDPVNREAVERSVSSLRSVDSKRKAVMRQLSLARTPGLNAVSSLLNVAVSQHKAADVQKLVIGNLITCRVSASTLQQLQQHNQVLWIDIDRTANLNIPENNSNISEPATTRTTTPTISSNVNFVEAPRVWNEFKITGKGIVVALLDSGVDYNHPDLQGNMWLSAEYPHYGWDFVDNDNDPIDEQGHGTHCAGTIAGKRTGAISCGIAPDATIMIVRILDKSNGGILSNFLKGIDFAVRNNADLISASLGFGNLPYPTKNMARQAFDDLALFNIPAIIAA